jgi:hypothetical protein
VIVRTLVAAVTGTAMRQAETLVQVIGYSTPLIRIVLTWAAAMPVSVTRLFDVVMKFVPTVKLVPVAALMALRTTGMRAVRVLSEFAKLWPGAKLA